jgi:hypothetical protein
MSQSSADPRLIVSKNTPLVLTTTFQPIVFDATEANKTINTFGKDPVTGKFMFHYDPVTNLFTYNENYPHNFNLEFEFTTLSTIISTKATMQLRFSIPNGISAGVDLNFPYENNGGFTDVYDVTLFNTAVNNKTYKSSLYIGDALKVNGFRIMARLSNSVLGSTSIQYSSLNIQGISRN